MNDILIAEQFIASKKEKTNAVSQAFLIITYLPILRKQLKNVKLLALEVIERMLPWQINHLLFE